MILLNASCLLAGSGLPAGAAENVPSKPPTLGPQGYRDSICGPRCVQMILAQYDKEVDLMDLVKETQWPEIENGANLAALEKALKSRGVFTCAIKLAPEAELVWKHPVLVHVDDGGTLGHFVVWIPPSASRPPVVWEWLKGTREWSHRQGPSWSGNVLLTAPRPIEDPASAVRSPHSTRMVLIVLGAVLVACAGILTATSVWRRCAKVPAMRLT
jgi:hypothetical protein